MKQYKSNCLIEFENLEKSFEDEPKNVRKIFDGFFNGMIGSNLLIKSPFKCLGSHLCIYTDFTASGRAFQPIEDYMSKQILKFYANIHSSGVYLADNTQNFRNEAKNILRKYVGADKDNYVIFTGQGATSAISKAIMISSLQDYIDFYADLLNLKKNSLKFNIKDLDSFNEANLIKKKFEKLFISKDQEWKPIEFVKKKHNNLKDKNFLQKLVDDCERFKPVFFYSELEHNSNRLPWIEKGKNEEGDEEEYIQSIKIIEHYDLKKKLKENAEKFKNQNQNEEDKEIEDFGSYVKFGSFSAASNITGKFQDVDLLSIYMHQRKGLAFFDYAAGAPYLQMKMNGPLDNEYRELLGFEDDILNEDLVYCYKDAIFFSTHKFLGGVNTPGVLICNKDMIRSLIPTQPGGGTVMFVTERKISYTPDIEAREESGTPDIAGSIRAGLTIKLRSEVVHKDLAFMDKIINNYVTRKLSTIKNLYILRDFDVNKEHLPIYSFLIHFNGKFFHQNYISCLLNDLFGIQSRPGCSCAPLYAQHLLNLTGDDVDIDIIKKLEYYSTNLQNPKRIFMPGFTRLNFPYFYPKFIIDYILEAIKFVAEYGYLFLGFYDLDIATGKCSFKKPKKEGDKPLIHIQYLSNENFKLDENNCNFIHGNFAIEDNFGKLSIDEKYKIIYSILQSNLSNVYSKIDKKFNEELNEYSQTEMEFTNEEKFDRWFLIYDDVKSIERIYKYSDQQQKDEFNKLYLLRWEGWKKKGNHFK